MVYIILYPSVAKISGISGLVRLPGKAPSFDAMKTGFIHPVYATLGFIFTLLTIDNMVNKA